MSLLRIALSVAWLSGVCVAAEEATTRPTTGDRPVHRDFRERVREKVGRGGGFMGRPLPDPSPEEWEMAQKFLSKVMPKRLGAFQKQVIDPEKQKIWKRAIFARYDFLQRLKKDEALYEQHVRALKAEDEIFGLAADYALAGDAAKREEITVELRKKIERLVSGELEGRQQRIERLNQALQEEKQRLQEDQSRKEQNIEDRLKQALEGGGELEMRRPVHKGQPEKGKPGAEDQGLKREGD